MKVEFGICAAARNKGQAVQVAWDAKALVNGHVLICGMTGSGKTHTLKKMIQGLLRSASETPRVHVMDVHGDIHIPGADTVLFSEQTNYGINPLKINPDPHFGGVRKRIQSFIGIMNKAMRKLGSKQEAVLRHILIDIYARHGFRQEDPRTWLIHDDSTMLVTDGTDNRLYIDVPKAEKDMLKDLRIGAQYDANLYCWWVPPEQYQGAVTRWPPKRLSRTHPTLIDALRYAKHRVQMSFLGTGLDAITTLEIANRASASYQRKLMEALRRGERAFDDEKAQEDIEKAKLRAIESYTEYINAITTGREFADLLRYDSTDVLKSVVERLENLNAIGIFKDAAPPFKSDAPVWHYDIKALLPEERKLFVLFKLEEIFSKAIERGETDKIVEVVVLDEAHMYADDDPDNIINTIAKEARKFGLALICASQSPSHFPEDFVAAVATKIILGIDEMYWRGSATKLRLTEKALAWIKLRQTMLVQLKTKTETRNDWHWVLTSPPAHREQPKT